MDFFFFAFSPVQRILHCIILRLQFRYDHLHSDRSLPVCRLVDSLPAKSQPRMRNGSWHLGFFGIIRYPAIGQLSFIFLLSGRHSSLLARLGELFLLCCRFHDQLRHHHTHHVCLLSFCLPDHLEEREEIE